MYCLKLTLVIRMFERFSNEHKLLVYQNDFNLNVLNDINLMF